jgi:signal transduction histidine kinase
MIRRTLTFRLIAGSFAWLAATLFATGALMAVLFRDYIERRFDAALMDHLEELVAAAEIDREGALTLTWVPVDPRFNRPQSGWYWQIREAGAVMAQSDSIWGHGLELPDPRAGAGPQTQEFVGPRRQPLRAILEDITLPEADRHFTFVVVGPIADIDRDVAEFASQLALTLTALGIGLLGAVLFQIRFGLGPLRAMQRALADVRSGRSRRLPETFPAEIQPVVSELNALLDHSETLLDRARTQVGNLAHALKNPLTVIANEAREVDGERGALLREEALDMKSCIDRYLTRARAAGSEGVLGARVVVKGVVEDLRFSLDRLYRDRALDIRVGDLEGLLFHGDAQDLEEMLGNLLDNACKWARRQVLVHGCGTDGRLRISVEDDGPGIPQSRETEVLRRGARLDEATPGSGLGLDIVREVAALYHGSLTLGRSSLGGARAELDLPADD